MMKYQDRMNMVGLAGLLYDRVEYATGEHKSKTVEKEAFIRAAENAETLAKILRKAAGQSGKAGE